MKAIRVDNAAPGRHSPRVHPVQAAFAAALDAELADLEARGLRRRLRQLDGPPDREVTIDGRGVLLLSSNNYLGLATHPALRRAAHEAIDRWGCGTGSSRLIAGHSALHAAVERQLARLKGTEAAVLCPSGYQANAAAIGALVGRGDHVFSDALNHASIIDGCRLSRADVHVFPHRDLDTLERMLAGTPRAGRRLVVTDSVFSMDGDCAPLDALVTLAERYHSLVMVDEAHATGAVGPRGAGLAAAAGLTERIAVHMGTLGKALGGAGAYVAGSRALVDLIVNRGRAFVFTTGLAPAATAAAGAALEVCEREPERRERLQANARRLRSGLRALGLRAEGDTHIIPVLLGDNRLAVAFGEALLARGVLVQPIRPPTVPPGTARLRVTPMATHTDDDLERTLAAFAAAGRASGALP
jgi:8-amino-7-oxononanoate synthase